MSAAAAATPPIPLGPRCDLSLPLKLLPILKPKRFKVMHGGRGGAKSHTIAQVLVARAMQGCLRILCVREVQKSLRDSVWQLLLDYIAKFKLTPFFKVIKSESRIECLLTGSTFAFSGLKDHTRDSLKSFEGVDIVWVEEAHSVSQVSWDTLIPTIRKADSEIWVSFNPDQEEDYAYKRWVLGHDPDAWVVQINWRDNPWFGEIMDTERRKMRALNDDLYQHVWEGKPRTLAGLLFKRHWFKRYDLGQQPKNLRMYLSSDYAGEPDPDNPMAEPDWTEHGAFGMDVNDQVWITDWWSGQEAPKVYIDAWINLIRVHKPLRAFEEKGVILRTISGYINRAMRAAGLYVVRDGLASSGSKWERALGFAALAQAGMVWIPRGEWGDRLVNQLCAFTGQEGKVDDMADVCSKFAQGLDMVIRATPEGSPDRPAKVDADTPRPGAPARFTEAYMRQLEEMDRADEADRERFLR